ncbi:MAG: hypothetical protein RDV48_09215 [Candidatus Eremiobacteraeota bacterium]|nr:hypothetical protein [Candidatus Eremiobacteraeota bacterium]
MRGKTSCTLRGNLFIQRFKEEYRSDQVIVTRFLREGAILKGIHDPHVVHVEEVGGDGRALNFYIQMELLNGIPLRKAIDEKQLPQEWERS